MLPTLFLKLRAPIGCRCTCRNCGEEIPHERECRCSTCHCPSCHAAEAAKPPVGFEGQLPVGVQTRKMVESHLIPRFNLVGGRKQWYDVLGVEKDSDRQEVEKKYSLLKRQWDPSKWTVHDAQTPHERKEVVRKAALIMKEINGAWDEYNHRKYSRFDQKDEPTTRMASERGKRKPMSEAQRAAFRMVPGGEPHASHKKPNSRRQDGSESISEYLTGMTQPL